MSKHSETPWSLEMHAPYGWTVRAARERNLGAGTLICQLSGYDAAADARLIAAAPKMLEALKGILPFVAEDFPPGNDFPVTHGYARAYRAILDAIALAEPLP